MSDSNTIKIEILGTRLQLRGGDNPEKVKAVAEFVRDRVHELAERAPTAPSLQLALLTAINIADELHAQEQQAGSEEDVDAALEKANQILQKASNI